jgi:hypothetical protein
VKEVPIADLDEWYSEKSVCRWRGEPFDVMGVDGDVVKGTYAGRDMFWAVEAGLTRLDYAWFIGDLPLSEVEDLHVQRTDLLAKWKQEQGDK